MYVVILLWLVNLCLSVTSDRRKWRYGVIFLFIDFVLLISWRSNIDVWVNIWVGYWCPMRFVEVLESSLVSSDLYNYKKYRVFPLKNPVHIQKRKSSCEFVPTNIYQFDLGTILWFRVILWLSLLKHWLKRALALGWLK